MAEKIAVVIGVGAEAGLGAAMCRRAANEGYHVVASGRTLEKLEKVTGSIKAAGGKATAITADVTDQASVGALFQKIDGMDGALALTVYNAGNASGAKCLEMSADVFEAAWRVCCLGGFYVGQEAGKRMVDLGAGTILYTGATASLKSRPPFMAFASGKAGLRAIAGAFARELGPQGVHVAHAIIDGGIDGEILNSRMPELKDKMGENGMLKPEAIADAYWHLHTQHPSAWTFEIDLRPYKETF